MDIADYRVEPADFKVDLNDLRSIREAVFIVEQNIPEDIEYDDIDSECFHFIARDDQHRAIGTGRLSPDQKIGRMAVLHHWRGKGIGKSIMQALLAKAQKLGWTEVKLNAQTAVIGFYEKFGFTKEGDVFMEANIPHQCMCLKLEPVEYSGRPDPKPRDAAVEISEFTTIEATITAALQLIAQTRRELRIYSADLEPILYGRADVVEALKQFAINSSGGNILIIVQDTLAVRAQPHPLIDLAQRLPSLFTLRTPTEPADLQYPSAFIINDRDGYLFRQQSQYYRGVWSPVMPSRNRQLQEEFDSVWQRCRPCTEFRMLGI